VGKRALGNSDGRRPARARGTDPIDGGPRQAGRPVGTSGDRTRERVLAAALEAFAEQGFAGTSMRDIARKARIRVSSLYHYFPSKESLYGEVQAKAEGERRQLVLAVMSEARDLREVTREATGRLFDFLVANPAYVRLGLHDRLEGGVLFDRRTFDRWLGLMEGMMKPAEMQGRMKPVDPVAFIASVDALVHWHAANNGYYRAMLGKGFEDPAVVRRAREHVVQVVLRMVGLE
jgi:AcrR family transcriptional regulator